MLLASLLTACAVPVRQSKARIGELVIARKQARGAWIVLHYGRKGSTRSVSGELLAANADSIFLLASDHLHSMPTSATKTASVTVYEAPSQEGGPPVLVLRRPWSWKTLVSHARFPQGLPADFARQAAGP